MEKIYLEAGLRKKTGKKASRRMFHAGRLPAILYGGGEALLPIDLSLQDCKVIIRQKHNVVNLKLNNAEIMVLVKEVQRHPVTGRLLHVDFYRIQQGKKLIVSVPIALTGEAPGVKIGGVLEHMLWEVEVECLPKDIPEKIEIDVSSLNIGDALHVRDLTIGEGGKIVTNSEKTVISIVPPTVIKEEVLPEEEEVVEEEKEEVVEGEKEEKRKEEVKQ
ncbi:50S ribosomal protein L25 [candidate division NPL-UPA2 bacterium Unc8]|uniref:Large ribosomal subunit protein bL25 n=1 Tax=candidate division NPL-UPA2 bacterium Unc8 TaxID=1980939 RepID=A0A399FX83_UNCN2|nr:50S ribosomal protein L25 [Bacillota bacterium]RII01015.1 MAG: 50S ribosomal protein L25 [candidate division NPL-UPA2 bacterium Unc8]